MPGFQESRKCESVQNAKALTGTSQEKKCTRRGEVKLIIEFFKNKTHKDGYATRCKVCAGEAIQKWRTAHSEKVKEYYRKWWGANPEKAKECCREWQRANLDKGAIRQRNRRARKRNAEGAHTETDIKKLFLRQGGLCNACGKKLVRYKKKQYHVDHIVPLAKGGGNGPDNLQLLCPPCNLSKHAKNPIQWARENGRLF